MPTPPLTPQDGFSKNNWLWGAASGKVNGNNNECNGNQVEWGHGNYDSMDALSCKRVYQNGVWQEYEAAVSYMYMLEDTTDIDADLYNAISEVVLLFFCRLVKFYNILINSPKVKLGKIEEVLELY